ncbi:MAG: RdgB/HAM1 family non-canonical purine NTP pyrophosphatase [Promethearchaeota archaeon]
MVLTIHFATGNPHKFAEAKLFLENSVDGVVLKQLEGDLPELQADSLEEVARFKILSALDQVGGNIFIEDAGLFIPSLGGFPGVYSAYVKKMIDCNGILKLLAGVDEPGARKAYFEACDCLFYEETGRIMIFTGRVDGTISTSERGKNGFGFDPIFIPDVPGGNTRTFAEMRPGEKVKLSHRTRALEKLKEFLLNNPSTER